MLLRRLCPLVRSQPRTALQQYENEGRNEPVGTALLEQFSQICATCMHMIAEFLAISAIVILISLNISLPLVVIDSIWLNVALIGLGLVVVPTSLPSERTSRSRYADYILYLCVVTAPLLRNIYLLTYAILTIIVVLEMQNINGKCILTGIKWRQETMPSAIFVLMLTIVKAADRYASVLENKTIGY